MGWKLTRDELKEIVKESIDEREEEKTKEETSWNRLGIFLLLIPFVCLMVCIGLLAYDVYFNYGVSNAMRFLLIIQILCILLGTFSVLIHQNQKLKKKLKDKEAA